MAKHAVVAGQAQLTPVAQTVSRARPAADRPHAQSPQFAEKTLHICQVYDDYPIAVPTTDYMDSSVSEGCEGHNVAKVSFWLGAAWV